MDGAYFSPASVNYGDAMKTPENVLELEIAYLKEAHAANEKRIAVLEAYKSKTERYGWFAMGIIAVGIYIASSLESAIKFIGKIAP